MAEATKDEGVLFKTNVLGIDLEYTKTDAAIDGALVAGGAMLGGVGAVPAAGIAAARSGIWMLGRGIARSLFNSAAKQGAEVAAKTVVKETAEAGVKAAAKEGAEAVAKKGAVEWVAPTLSKESAEFAAKKAAERAAREAAEAAAKTAAKEGTEAAAGAAAKTVTNEAVESTSKSILGMAGKTASMAWSGVKIATFPFRHPVLTLGAVGGAHIATDGASSELIWDGAIGTWNLAGEYIPGAAAGVADATLALGDGVVGFLATGGKKGAEGLADHLPPGTPSSIRVALGSVGEEKPEGKTNTQDQSAPDKPSLREQAAGAFDGAKDRAADAKEDMGDFLEGAEAAPFRQMLGNFMGLDPKEVNGKKLVAVLKEKAKDNPEIAFGMAIGAWVGKSKSSSLAEAAWKVPLYSAIFAISAHIFAPILAPFLGLAGSKLKDAFHSAQLPKAEQETPTGLQLQQAPTSAPVADTTVSAANEAPESAFRQNANGMTAQADRDLRVNRPMVPSANAPHFALQA